MNAKTLANMFSSHPRERQAKILACCAHALTLDARDTYIPGTEGIADPVRLRGFNEIEHQTVAQLEKILDLDANRYPDDVFFGMMLDAVKQLRANNLRAELEKLAHQVAARNAHQEGGLTNGIDT